MTPVINPGGQDHRWLGNGYRQAQRVTVIASAAAVADQQARAAMQRSALALGTLHRGPAHAQGEAPVWLAERGAKFPGDIVRVDRLPGAGPARYTHAWLAVFEAVAAFAPAPVIRGQAGATDLATARRDTCDFLGKLRSQIGASPDEGRSIPEAPGIDQSVRAGLVQFDSLAGRNAQATHEKMEGE